MEIDTLLLARIQFAFTISFHIIFPSMTIGLASFLAIIEGRWLYTGNSLFKDIYKFWVKIFAITFGIGVVSGVVMSYEIGTNWSVFADKISNVLGPLMGFEVLTAFFLEASFLGIMLFGWGRVSDRMHFAATTIVAIGTTISAFWILSANSWMQTPSGFEIDHTGRLLPMNWFDIIFNPSFVHRFLHMLTAAYLTATFIIGGVAALYLFQKKYIPQAKIMLKIATCIAVVLVPAQIHIGHDHGLNTMEYQPIKLAAMEGNWSEERHAPLILFGIPTQEKMEYEIKIPGLSSWILTGDINGKIPRLNDYPPENYPPIFIVFWSFRIMVGVGVLMLITAIISFIQLLRQKLFDNKYLQLLWIMMIPSGFIAILAGWSVTEVGRQPWTVYNIIRTVKSISPGVNGHQVAWSLITIIIMYCLIFCAGLYYILKIINKGFVINTMHKYNITVSGRHNV